METKSIGDYSWNEIEEMKDFIFKEELKRKFLKEKEELLTNRVLRKCAEEYLTRSVLYMKIIGLFIIYQGNIKVNFYFLVI